MRLSLILPMLTLLLMGAGCSTRNVPVEQTSEPTDTPVAKEIVVAPSITVVDQSIDDSSITLGPVTMTVDGWLVAYENDGEKPGQILGYEYVPTGEHTTVLLPIEDDAYAGKVYIAPHYDRGTSKQYEFPGVDMPLEIDGVVPVTSFVIE